MAVVVSRHWAGVVVVSGQRAVPGLTVEKTHDEDWGEVCCLTIPFDTVTE